MTKARGVWLGAGAAEVGIWLSLMASIATIPMENGRYVDATLAGAAVFGVMAFALFFGCHIYLGLRGGKGSRFAIIRGGVYLTFALLVFPALTLAGML